MDFDIERVREAYPGRSVDWLQTTQSTMKDAWVAAQHGAISGSLLGAEEQTAGQGRLGRVWHSAAGKGLYFTLVLRVKLQLAELPVLTIALGLAVAEAVRVQTGLVCDLKWPNDLLINGRKCCGILSEFQDRIILAGIGSNVNQAGFPPELSHVATSLRVEGRVEYSRESLLICLLEEVDKHVALLESQGKKPLLDLFTHGSSFVRGKRVEVEQSGRVITGVTDGMSDAGFLYVRQADGERVLILAGGLKAI